MEAVFFDAGGTLFDPFPSVGAIYAACARSCGIESPGAGVLDRAFSRAFRKEGGMRHLTREVSVERERCWWRRVVRETFGEMIDRHSFSILFDRLYARFVQPDAWHVYDDVHTLLPLLSGRVRITGIVSNWDSRLPVLLNNLGLGDWFDPVVVSTVRGVAKPDPAIFVRACELAGVAPGKALHIGDRVAEDYHAPRAAGMHACLIDRHHTRYGKGIETIASLREVPEVIERYDSRSRVA